MDWDLSKVIVAVDFDGTIVEHNYPDIGPECPGAVETLKWLHECGAKIILWTMRSRVELVNAVAWCVGHGITLGGVNKNPDQDSWTTSPKAYAHIYIDDAALGCPLQMDSEGVRVCVDWMGVRELLETRFEIIKTEEELTNLPAGVEA